MHAAPKAMPRCCVECKIRSVAVHMPYWCVPAHFYFGKYTGWLLPASQCHGFHLSRREPPLSSLMAGAASLLRLGSCTLSACATVGTAFAPPPCRHCSELTSADGLCRSARRHLTPSVMAGDFARQCPRLLSWLCGANRSVCYVPTSSAATAVYTDCAAAECAADSRKSCNHRRTGTS